MIGSSEVPQARVHEFGLLPGMLYIIGDNGRTGFSVDTMVVMILACGSYRNEVYASCRRFAAGEHEVKVCRTELGEYRNWTRIP